MKPKYYFEIDTGGEEASGYEDRHPWVCYGTIVAEGDTLEECLESASVDLVDQDGGERGMVEADEDWMQTLIVEAFYRGKVPSGSNERRNSKGETFGDFLARMEREYAAMTQEEKDALEERMGRGRDDV